MKAYHRVESLYGYPNWRSAALLQAGKCHEMAGRWGDAAQLYGLLLKEYPNTQYASEANQRLQIAQQEVDRTTPR